MPQENVSTHWRRATSLHEDLHRVDFAARCRPSSANNLALAATEIAQIASKDMGLAIETVLTDANLKAKCRPSLGCVKQGACPQNKPL